MARKGLNIYKRKDGRWEGRYKQTDGKTGISKYRSVYGKSYKETREKLLAANNNKGEVTSRTSLTVKNLFSLWLEYIRPRVKSSTYSTYVMKLEKHIYPALGNTNYGCLTATEINSFIYSTLGAGYSAKYVYDIAILLKSLGKYARKVYNYSNPASDIDLPRVQKKETALLTKNATSVLTKRAAIEKSGTDIGIMLGLYVGLRLGEICALKWSDIDFRERTIKITKTMTRIKAPNNGLKTKTEIIITQPKSAKSIREIPLPGFIYTMLNTMEKEGDMYILSGKKHYVEPRLLQYRFKQILKKEKLPSINFHALRHTFATNCISAGFDIKTLSEILGHASVEITLNKYIHSSIDRKRECMQLLKPSFDKKPSELAVFG